MNSILLLEDDRNLNRGITLLLEKEGYRVFSAYSAADARKLFSEHAPDMVISDIALPDGNGLDFGKWLRNQSDAALIYLTAAGDEIDIVNGYAQGADDYVTKPFSLMVLTSKVNAIMRRLHGNEQPVLVSDEIEVNLREMCAYCKNEAVPLSRTEFQLLVFFLENAGRVLSREQILEQVWGSDGQFVDDNTVTVNISRLKNKLGTEHLSNVRGLGYLWNGKVVKK